MWPLALSHLANCFKQYELLILPGTSVDIYLEGDKLKFILCHQISFNFIRFNCSGFAKTADRRVAQTEGVAAQQMEKAEQAKQFDKQTNKQTQKQTNKLDKKEA